MKHVIATLNSPFLADIRTGALAQRGRREALAFRKARPTGGHAAADPALLGPGGGYSKKTMT